MKNDNILPYAPVIIKLLQGIVYQDDNYWEMLLQHQAQVKNYLGKIGIELYLDEAEGYAYLQQQKTTWSRRSLPRRCRG